MSDVPTSCSAVVPGVRTRRHALQACGFAFLLWTVALYAHVHEDAALLSVSSMRRPRRALFSDRVSRLSNHSFRERLVPPKPAASPPSPPRPASAHAKKVPPRGALESTFCIRAGYPSELPVLLTATVPLARARRLCVAEAACAAFSLRTDGARGADLHAVLFRAARDPNASDSRAVEALAPLALQCNDAWISFVRGVADCGRPASSSDGALDPERDVEREATASREWNITVVTQLSINRFAMLLELATRWPGPLVAAATHEPDATLPALPIHLAERVQLLLSTHRRGEAFPINRLRNMAIAMVATSHFFVLDVDLWPSAGLVPELMALDAAWWRDTPKLALLVPAFQLNAHQSAVAEALAMGDDPLPADVSALRGCVQHFGCTAFKGQPLDGQHAIPGQQLSTDFARWFLWERRALPYRVPCFDKPSFEPYLIVRKDADTPRFDEQFVGYGKNKVQWVQALRAAGFSFWVLPRGFVVHVPHPKTRAVREWDANLDGHKERMDQLFQQQLATARQREAAADGADGVQHATRTSCTRTPECKMPLAQFIDPLDWSLVGRRAPAKILA